MDIGAINGLLDILPWRNIVFICCVFVGVDSDVAVRI